MKDVVVGFVLMACCSAVWAEPDSSAKKVPSPPELEAAWKDGFMAVSPCEDELDGLGLAELKKKAQAGDANAAVYVAVECIEGKGKADLPSARVWAERAAKAGQRDGQLLFAQLHYYGLGGPTNDAEAARWFRVASTNDSPHANYWLGRCLADGRGVAKDLKRAEELMRKVSTRDDCDDDVMRGLANEWLFDHGLTPELPRYKGMSAAVKVDFKAPQPPACVDPDGAPADYGKDGPLFLPDAKAALLVADPADNPFFRKFLGTCFRFDLADKEDIKGFHQVRWCAVSVLDLRSQPDDPYQDDLDEPRSFRPKIDIGAAVGFAGAAPALTNDCFKSFKEKGLSGWDVRLPEQLACGLDRFVERFCATRTDAGAFLFATNHKTLRRLVELYRVGKGGFPELSRPSAKVLALSIPKSGSFLCGLFDPLGFDGQLATWCAYGSEVIEGLKAASLDARLSRKGFLKLKLEFEAHDEREATLLRRPLIYHAQCFAAEARKPSAVVPDCFKDLLAHFRVGGKNGRVTVETHFKFDDLIVFIRSSTEQKRQKPRN